MDNHGKLLLMKKALSMSNPTTASLTQHLSSVSENSDVAQTEVTMVEASAGVLLRNAREAAGLHIAVLAGILKVPVKKLDALEAGRLNELPDAVFIRALASSICRTLKIDSALILQQLPKNISFKSTDLGISINTPFRATNDGPRPSFWGLTSRPAVLSGVLLLLSAWVIFMLPAVKSSINKTSNLIAETSKTEFSALAPPVVLPGQATADIALTPVFAPDIPSAPIITSIQNILPISVPLPSLVSAEALKAPDANAASSQLASLSALPSFPAGPQRDTATLPSTSIVEFNAKGASWVEVTDAKGVVVLRRTLSSGETATASGVFPLTAVVGRADATEVKIRGKGFNLSSFTKDNVARFEVK